MKLCLFAVNFEVSHDGTVPSEGSDRCRRSAGVVWVFAVYSVASSGPAPSFCHAWGENSDRTGRDSGLTRVFVLMHSHIVLFSMCRVPYVKHIKNGNSYITVPGRGHFDTAKSAVTQRGRDRVPFDLFSI